MLSEQELRDIRDRRIIRANELIQKFNNRFSARQQKIILYLISSIDQYSTELSEVEFSVSDFCQVCGIPAGGQFYKELENELLTIASTQISTTVIDEYGERNNTNLMWIRDYHFYSSGIVRITLKEEMKPYLLQLQERFTQTQLLFSVHFKSKYTLRLYDYICSIHYDKQTKYNRRYTLKEVRGILGVDDGVYPEYKELKRCALKPAIDEINKCSDKHIELIEMRKGRSITHIEFEITSVSIAARVKAAATAENDLNGKKDKGNAS